MGNIDYQICVRCVMDTTDVEIQFDDEGVCNHCKGALQRMQSQPAAGAERRAEFERLVEKVKQEGKGKPYDCIIGVSGGLDSTMVAHEVVKSGLRPLAVHLDNGWNSELAVDNIRKTIEGLGIDLHTHVINWNEFKDLQLCFLKASIANCEAPTDHAITALLFKMASTYNVKYILSGSNLVTEAIMPYSWGHYNQDLRLLRALHRRFGTRSLSSYPTIGLLQYFYYVLVKGVRQVPLLNYLEYDRDRSKAILSKELGWRDYGGKHYESVWTRFFQGYYLPEKFGYDKRRAHLSTLICSDQIERQAALDELELPPYDESLLSQDLEFVIKKFELTQEKFDALMTAPMREAREYPSHYFLFHRMRRYKNIFRKIATSV